MHVVVRGGLMFAFAAVVSGRSSLITGGDLIRPGSSYQFVVSAGCWDVDAGSIGVGEARQRMTVQAGGITQYTVTG